MHKLRGSKKSVVAINYVLTTHFWGSKKVYYCDEVFGSNIVRGSNKLRSSNKFCSSDKFCSSNTVCGSVNDTFLWQQHSVMLRQIVWQQHGMWFCSSEKLCVSERNMWQQGVNSLVVALFTNCWVISLYRRPCMDRLPDLS